jgi:Domain of unknown function (DUF202)
MPAPAPAPPPRPAKAASPRRAQDMPPGLARERTQLAWTRTVVAFAAVGGALLKNHLVAGLIVLGMGAVIWGLCRVIPQADPPRPQPVRLLIVTAGVTAMSLVALAVAIFSH